MIVNANSIAQDVIQNKNGIMKHANAIAKASKYKKIIIGAHAYVFVRTVSI